MRYWTAHADDGPGCPADDTGFDLGSPSPFSTEAASARNTVGNCSDDDDAAAAAASGTGNFFSFRLAAARSDWQMVAPAIGAPAAGGSGVTIVISSNPGGPKGCVGAMYGWFASK